MLPESLASELYSLMEDPPSSKLWQTFKDHFHDNLTWFDCWEWNGYRNEHGYGQMHRPGNSKGFSAGAHRRLCDWLYGKLPRDLVVDHLICSNPPCCNPIHLIPCTMRFNTLRPGSKSLSAACLKKTHCPQGHPLTEGNLHANWLKLGKRICLTCCRARHLRYDMAHRKENLERAKKHALKKKEARLNDTKNKSGERPDIKGILKADSSV